MKKEIHICDRCGADLNSKRPPIYKATISAPGYRQMSKSYDICSDCEEKLTLFLEEKLYKHAYIKVINPCPHSVPCADPGGCSGVSYRKAW